MGTQQQKSLIWS